MVSFFAAMDNRASPPQMVIYQGGAAVATGSTFSVAETTGLDAKNQNPRVAQFGPTKTLYAFVGDGVYKTEDGGGNWVFVYSPPNILGSNYSQRFGPLVLSLNGVPHLCIGWITGSDAFKIARSSDGINWEASENLFQPRTSNAPTNLVNHRSIIYTTSSASDVQNGSVRWFDFQNLSGGGFTSIGASNPITSVPVVHNDRIYLINYYTSPNPNDIELRELYGGTFSNVLATFGTDAISATTGTAAWSSNNRIYYAARSNTVGVRLFRTDVGLTTFSEITSTAVPSALQADTNATVIKAMLHPTSLDGTELLIYIRNSSNSWDIYRWRNDLESLQLLYSNVGSVDHTLPMYYSLQGTHFYNPSSARVEIVESIDRLNSLQIYFKLHGENGAVQNANVAFYYATNPGDNSITNSCTLTDPSAGSISGNQVRNITADNGVTTYSVKWNLLSDGFSIEDRYKLITSISINRPLRRRKKRKKWYKF